MTSPNEQSARVAAIEVEIFNHLFQSVAEEMGVVLMRAAFSPNIKERRDHSCALFDARGELLAQAAHIPVHLGSMPLSVKAAIDAFDMTPGSVVLLNDPYSGGTHLPDLTLVSPVFAPHVPTPVFYVANRAHHADVGGLVPGSLPLSTHIDQEGFRAGPTIIDGERLNDAVIERFCRASRTPEERRGDLAAQTAANRLGERRTRELLDRYGLETLSSRGELLKEYSAKLMRAIIADIPDGVYEVADVMDGDGFDLEDVTIRCRLTIDGEHCRFDFSDTDDQVPGPINAVRSITLSAVFYSMRCLGPREMPTNAGCLAPIELVTRAGSLVDAVYPAAVAAGNVETSQRIVDVVMRALAEALPERIPAASVGSMGNVMMGGGEGPDAFVYYETVGGGSGAGPGWDGESGVHTHMTNTLNTPAEALEHAYPLRLTAYHLRRGSGGDGRYRGGDGIVREYAFVTPTVVTTIADRHRNGPYGLAGGSPGAPGRIVLIHEDGRHERLPSKGTFTCKPGQRLRVETAGGGGFGTE